MMAAPLSANAATQSIGRVPAHQKCDVHLSKNVNFKPTMTCSTSTLSYSTEVLSETLSPAASGTLLVSFYRDQGFGGQSVFIKGNDGPCDSSGYGIKSMGTAEGWWYTIDPVGEAVLQSASSYRVYNSCNETIMYTGGNYGGTSSGARFGDQTFVGNTFNDKIRSFRMMLG